MIPDYPITDVEKYLNKIATDEGIIPDYPNTRIEHYLDYIVKNGGKGTTKGYYYNGQFYSDIEHTKIIQGQAGNIYYDQTTGKKRLYFYNGESYQPVASTEGSGKFLSYWNCATGLPASDPSTELPYEYHTGDYYIINNISTGASAVNYKPDGTSYTGEASEVVETENVQVRDEYWFDGEEWLLLSTSKPDTITLTFSNSDSTTTTINFYGNEVV